MKRVELFDKEVLYPDAEVHDVVELEDLSDFEGRVVHHAMFSCTLAADPRWTEEEVRKVLTRAGLRIAEDASIVVSEDLDSRHHGSEDCYFSSLLIV